MILEITRLEYSSFFSKCSKFNAPFRNAIKNPEEVFCFRDNGASSCCMKFSMFRLEYFSSVVNVLTDSVKISDWTIADFTQLNYLEFMTKYVNSSCEIIQQCLEPVNTLTNEWCSEARPFRRLSNHLFRSQ